MVDNTLLRRMSNLDTASLCDADKTLRVVGPEIKCLSKAQSFLGPAKVVKCEKDFLGVLWVLLREANEGDVLVVCGGGERKAYAGELFAHEARRKKLSAIVIDGFVRDADSITVMEFPIYASGFVPIAGTASKIAVSSEEGVFAGIKVSRGDIVCADADGMVFLKHDELNRVISAAESIKELEQRVMRSVQEGRSLRELTNVDDHVKMLEQGKESGLKFVI